MEQKSWWSTIPAYAKYDELLDDGTDDYLLRPILRDGETLAEHSGRCEYILYGGDQALLYRPKHLIPRLAMELYVGMLSVIRRQ